jgi:hypothetical protein
VLSESAITTHAVAEITPVSFADLCAVFVDALELDVSGIAADEAPASGEDGVP